MRRTFGLLAALVLGGAVTGSGAAYGYGGDNVPPQIAISATVVEAGGQLTVQGVHFTPTGSVDLSLHSAPTALGTVHADVDGAFVSVVTIPATEAAGEHTLTALDVATGDEATAGLTVERDIDPVVPPVAGTGVAVAPLVWSAAAALILGLVCAAAGARRSTA